MKMAWSIYYKNDDQSTRIEYTRVTQIVTGVMYHKAETTILPIFTSYMYLENDNSLPDTSQHVWWSAIGAHYMWFMVIFLKCLE